MKISNVDKKYYCGPCNVVSVIGIIGNVLSIIILYPSKYHRTKALFYGYLAALAVSDLLFLLSNLVYWYEIQHCCSNIFVRIYFSSNLKCFGYYNLENVRSYKTVQWTQSVDYLHEFFTSPSDLMVCFGTMHRLYNVNTSFNSKVVIEKKRKQRLLGKN